MASDQRFASSQGQERQLLIVTHGNLRNDGKSTAFVSFSHGARLSEEPPWVVDVSERPGSPLYAIAPGALASFQLLGGRPLCEWMEAYRARAADSGEHPEESELWFEVTVTDQLDAGIIDRIQVIVGGRTSALQPQFI